MKTSLRHGDSVDSMSEFASFDSSRGEDIDFASGQGDDFSSLYLNANGVNQEGVFQLTKDVRKFSEALTSLKAVFLDDKSGFTRSLRVVAHERLGEMLQVLRFVVDKYPEMNSTEILTLASKLIKHVKVPDRANRIANQLEAGKDLFRLFFIGHGYNYEQESADVTPEIFRAINNLAMVFTSSVSEYLMGEDINSPVLAASSPSFESIAAPNRNITEEDGIAQDVPDTAIDAPLLDIDTDECLFKLDTGLDMAFDRAKILSKYLGELISYVKKKAHLEMEHSRSVLKLSQHTKSILSEQSFLPFQSLYCTSLDHEREYASNCHTVHQALYIKYVESLQAKKVEHDKKRKQIRDSWARERKRTEEAATWMKKTKQIYHAKMHEYRKAREAAMKAEGEQQVGLQPPKMSNSASSSALGGFYSSSGKVDKKRKQEEELNAKATNAEQAYRASIIEANRRVKDLDKRKTKYLQQLRELMLQCDQTAKNATLSFFQLHHQLYVPLPVQFQALLEDAKCYEPGHQYAEYVRNLPLPIPTNRSLFQFEPYPSDREASFIGPGGYSDTESCSSRSLDDLSPAGDLARSSGFRRHSTEDSLSSEDILDDPPTRDGKPPSSLTVGDSGMDPSPVPLRNFTKNAIRVAANVKGAFTSKKVSKPTLFGVDFSSIANNTSDGIPLLVKVCVAEIDNRALTSKGIYRMNGVKNRVERICSQFDAFSEKVDLSQHSPHDVTGALKHFLRQLSEPLLLSRYYDAFLDIAKDYQKHATTSTEESDEVPVEDVESYLKRLRDTVELLPIENRNTMQYIMAHLSRVAEHSRDNKMTASNLSIVFGPTLLRPPLNDGNESLESLIDLGHQSRVVELLIRYKDFVFNVHPLQAKSTGFQRLSTIDSTDASTSEVADGGERRGTEEEGEPQSKQVNGEETCQSDPDGKPHLADESTDAGPSLPHSVGVNTSESCPNFSDAYMTLPPSSNFQDSNEESKWTRQPAITRKIGIRNDKPPPLSSLDIQAPFLPARRRKKSQKASDETETSNSAPKNSDLPPNKDSIRPPSSSFHAGMEKLGIIARRFSRDNPMANLTSPSKRDPSDAIRPRKGANSRRSSAIQPDNVQPVLVLDNPPASPTDDDVSFC